MDTSRSASFQSIALVVMAMATFLAVPYASAQRKQPPPTMLMGPSDWRFERLPIPPRFAPDIKWSGYEEARFAPGMFDTESPNYFTYVLAVSIDGTESVVADDITDFLDKYFKGLSTGVGRRKGLSPDPAQFGATVTAMQKKEGDLPRFLAKVPYFDTFNDGRKILLNIEITIVPKTESGKTFVVLLISTQEAEAPVWKQLHAIGKTVGG